MPMSLNNNGDDISLINSGGASLDSVSYGPVGEGQVVNHP